MSDDFKFKTTPEAVRRVVQKLHGTPPPAPPQAPTPTPEWENPGVYAAGEWSIVARCRCEVYFAPKRTPQGRHCKAHSFADLVEGERRLRAAQQQEDPK